MQVRQPVLGIEFLYPQDVPISSLFRSQNAAKLRPTGINEMHLNMCLFPQMRLIVSH